MTKMLSAMRSAEPASPCFLLFESQIPLVVCLLSKSALFALATSEVLIVNIWEHQVGLYQGANMGLLKG
jgi:hypothetical protein